MSFPGSHHRKGFSGLLRYWSREAGMLGFTICLRSGQREHSQHQEEMVWVHRGLNMRDDVGDPDPMGTVPAQYKETFGKPLNPGTCVLLKVCLS